MIQSSIAAAAAGIITIIASANESDMEALANDEPLSASSNIRVAGVIVGIVVSASLGVTSIFRKWFDIWLRYRQELREQRDWEKRNK